MNRQEQDRLPTLGDLLMQWRQLSRAKEVDILGRCFACGSYIDTNWIGDDGCLDCLPLQIQQAIQSIAEQAIRALEAEKTAESVAKVLEDTGSTGVPKCPDSCAIAQYLAYQLELAGAEELPEICVEPDGVVLVWENQIPIAFQEGSCLPEFIARFDRGEFPTLVLSPNLSEEV